MTVCSTAFGVDGALRHRDLTGEGQWIDAALYESAFRVMEYTPTLYGRQKVCASAAAAASAGRAAPSRRRRRWIVFTAPAQHLFERFCAMLATRSCRRTRASPARGSARRTSA